MWSEIIPYAIVLFVILFGLYKVVSHCKNTACSDEDWSILLMIHIEKDYLPDDVIREMILISIMVMIQ